VTERRVPPTGRTLPQGTGAKPSPFYMANGTPSITMPQRNKGRDPQSLSETTLTMSQYSIQRDQQEPDGEPIGSPAAITPGFSPPPRTTSDSKPEGKPEEMEDTIFGSGFVPSSTQDRKELSVSLPVSFSQEFPVGTRVVADGKAGKVTWNGMPEFEFVVVAWDEGGVSPTLRLDQVVLEEDAAAQQVQGASPKAEEVEVKGELPATGPAPQARPDDWVTSQDVVVRSTVKLDSSTVCTIPEGSQVTLGTLRDVTVNLDGIVVHRAEIIQPIRGWISSAFVTRRGASGMVSTPPASPTRVPRAEAQFRDASMDRSTGPRPRPSDGRASLNAGPATSTRSSTSQKEGFPAIRGAGPVRALSPAMPRSRQSSVEPVARGPMPRQPNPRGPSPGPARAPGASARARSPETTTPAVPKQAGETHVATAKLVVREGEGLETPVVGSLPPGSMVQLAAGTRAMVMAPDGRVVPRAEMLSPLQGYVTATLAQKVLQPEQQQQHVEQEQARNRRERGLAGASLPSGGNPRGPSASRPTTSGASLPMGPQPGQPKPQGGGYAGAAGRGPSPPRPAAPTVRGTNVRVPVPFPVNGGNGGSLAGGRTGGVTPSTRSPMSGPRASPRGQPSAGLSQTQPVSRGHSPQPGRGMPMQNRPVSPMAGHPGVRPMPARPTRR